MHIMYVLWLGFPDEKSFVLIFSIKNREGMAFESDRPPACRARRAKQG
jgi:hypothetical protein